VLVPRSSGTPVATWAWPTWVVSRRRVLEAEFILLEFPSPSRRIFIGSHSLPPSLVRLIGPSRSPTQGLEIMVGEQAEGSDPSYGSPDCGSTRAVEQDVHLVLATSPPQEEQVGELTMLRWWRSAANGRRSWPQ
jgi:hypothetical protein